MRLWFVGAGKLLRTLEGHQGEVWRVAFSPDGKLLASCAADKTVRLWDTASGQEVRRLEGHQGAVESVAFSPDGKLLASGAREPAARLWEVATGKEVRQLRAAGVGWVYSVAFSADGRTLAAGGLDNNVHLWEVATGRPRGVFAGHQGGAAFVTFAPDGRSLASGSADGTALVWDLTGHALARRKGALKLSPAELDGAWADLAHEDSARAYRALWALADAPGQALPLLARHLKPVPATDARRIARRIAELDADEFAVRERASAELERLGEAAVGALREAADKAASAEVQRRTQELLRKVRGGSSELLRTQRALEVLELTGTPEARRALERLASGAPEAGLTQEAKASLERLSKRAGARP